MSTCSTFRARSLPVRLRRAAVSLRDDPTTLRDLVDAHGDAARGSLLLLLAVPCALPIPGVGTALGVALLALVWALWNNHPAPLPTRILIIALPRSRARQVLAWLALLHQRASSLCRERLTPLVESTGERWMLACIAVMALLIVLPIPFGNVLPAIAVGLFGLAMVQRDGALALLGGVAATSALALPLVMAWGAWHAAGAITAAG